MKTSELKSGMKIRFQMRGDEEFMFFKDIPTEYSNETFPVIVSRTSSTWIRVDPSEDECYYGKINKVWIPSHPYTLTGRRDSWTLVYDADADADASFLTLDGVEYSKSTLRSLIKKATN